MASKIGSIDISKIKETDRFEPRFHLAFNAFEHFNQIPNCISVKLGDKRLLKRITDGEHAGQVFVPKGIRFIKNSSVKDFNINLLDDFFIEEDKHKILKRSALKAHDILFTTVGHLGACVIVHENFGEANINQNVVKIEVNSDFVNPYYLTVYLNSNLTKQQIAALFTGNIHTILTYPKIKNINVLIPSKEYQNEIADKYKLAIEKQKLAIDIINEAINYFYKKLDIDFNTIEEPKYFSVNLCDFKSNDLWLPKYSYPKYINTLIKIKEKFDVINLGEIASIKKGDEVGSKNYKKYLEKGESDVPFIRTSDFVNYEIDQYPDFYLPTSTFDTLQQDFKNGDILYSKDGKVGMTAMITKADKAVIASGIVRIRINEIAKKLNITNEYLFLLLSIKEIGLFSANRRTVVASTIPHLREERLKEFEIPIVEKELINKVSELIRNAFDMKNQAKLIISEIRNDIDKRFKN